MPRWACALSKTCRVNNTLQQLHLQREQQLILQQPALATDSNFVHRASDECISKADTLFDYLYIQDQLEPCKGGQHVERESLSIRSYSHKSNSAHSQADVNYSTLPASCIEGVAYAYQPQGKVSTPGPHVTL